MNNLLRQALRRHGAFVLASAVLLAGFQFLICAAIASVDFAPAIEMVLSSLPPLIQEMLASQFFGGFTTSGLVAFGWNHPVAHAVGAAVAIALGVHVVAGESESGAMELVLSQPVSRGAYFTAHVGFAFGAVFLVSTTGVLGTVLGQMAFGMDRFAAGPLVRLVLNHAALQAAAYGITLLLSVGAREGGRVATAAFVVVLVSFIAQVIGRLWPEAAFVRPWTLHEYFSPREILVMQSATARPFAILAAVTAVCLSLAWGRFRIRDLP